MVRLRPLHLTGITLLALLLPPFAWGETAKPQVGEGSFYGPGFEGRPMADGTPMDPSANTAASKSLPLGSKAEVINLENGRRAEVEITDRGPYVDGRIVDVTPKVARDLDMLDDGVVKVKVKPLPEGDKDEKGATTNSKAPADQKSGRDR